jgi:hypothetical protein
MIGCGFIGLVLLSTTADLDLHLSGYFYDPAVPQRWFLKTAVPWIWLDHYGEYPAGLLAVGAGVVWCGSLRRRAWCVIVAPVRWSSSRWRLALGCS